MEPFVAITISVAAQLRINPALEKRSYLDTIQYTNIPSNLLSTTTIFITFGGFINKEFNEGDDGKGQNRG